MTNLRNKLNSATAKLFSFGVTGLAYDPAFISLYSRGQLTSMLNWAEGTIEHVVATR
jgi:hypothetical protein